MDVATIGPNYHYTGPIIGPNHSTTDLLLDLVLFLRQGHDRHVAGRHAAHGVLVHLLERHGLGQLLLAGFDLARVAWDGGRGVNDV